MNQKTPYVMALLSVNLFPIFYVKPLLFTFYDYIYSSSLRASSRNNSEWKNCPIRKILRWLASNIPRKQRGYTRKRNYVYRWFSWRFRFFLTDCIPRWIDAIQSQSSQYLCSFFSCCIDGTRYSEWRTLYCQCLCSNFLTHRRTKSRESAYPSLWYPWRTWDILFSRFTPDSSSHHNRYSQK